MADFCHAWPQVDLELDHLGPLAARLLPDYHAPPPRTPSLRPHAITPSPSMGRSSASSQGSGVAAAAGPPHPAKAASFPPQPLHKPEHAEHKQRRSQPPAPRQQPREMLQQQQQQRQQQDRDLDQGHEQQRDAGGKEGCVEGRQGRQGAHNQRPLALRRISSHPLPLASEADSPSSAAHLQQPDLQAFSPSQDAGSGSGRRGSSSRGSDGSTAGEGGPCTNGLASGSFTTPSSTLSSPSPSPSPSSSPSPTPMPVGPSANESANLTSQIGGPAAAPAPSPFARFSDGDAGTAPGAGGAGLAQQPPLPSLQASASRHATPAGSFTGEAVDAAALTTAEERSGGPLPPPPPPSPPSWHSTLLGGISRGTGLEGLGHVLAPVGAVLRRGTAAAAAAGGGGRKSEEAAPAQKPDTERGATRCGLCSRALGSEGAPCARGRRIRCFFCLALA